MIPTINDLVSMGFDLNHAKKYVKINKEYVDSSNALSYLIKKKFTIPLEIIDRNKESAEILSQFLSSIGIRKLTRKVK